jgi:hypothetical protein
MPAKAISFRVPKEVTKSLNKMKTDGRKIVQVVGKLQNGKLEIAPESLAELTKMFPSANISFVAVNAPFRTI